jgi:hypothetical protein
MKYGLYLERIARAMVRAEYSKLFDDLNLSAGAVIEERPYVLQRLAEQFWRDFAHLARAADQEIARMIREREAAKARGEVPP